MRFKIPHKYVSVKLTKDEYDFIRSLGKLKALYWKGTVPGRGNGVKRDNYKNRIKKELLIIQEGCCAYCGLDFETRGESHRDHIAPKDDKFYPQFVFEPQNIILSCPVCNGLTVKSNTNTISSCKENYEECDFFIVHPYFDDYDKHIQYLGNEVRKGIIIKALTDKGKYTIDLFKLDSPHLTETRAQCILWGDDMLGDREEILFKQVKEFRRC